MQEQPRPAAPGAGRRHRLEGTHGGGADRDDAPTFGARPLHRRPGVGRHGVVLAVHRVRHGIVLGDRGERVEADHQLDTGDVDPVGGQPGEHGVGEVQAGGGGGGRSGPCGVHRLVAVGVGEGGVDVRRQRHHAVLVEHLERVAVAEQRDLERVTGVGAITHARPRRCRRGRAAWCRAASAAPGARAPPTCAASPSCGSSSSTSAAPPPGRVKASRAGITRVSLTTTRSPRRSTRGRSRTWRWAGGAEGPRSTSRRAESRGSTGCWAMRVGSRG